MLEDTFAHAFDDSRQFVAADVRVRFVEHRVRRAEEMEQFHHALHVSAFLGAREEFTIRECTCTTFAEAVVRFWIKPFVSVQQGNILLPFTYLLTPFVDDGLDAVFEERECCEQSRRSGSDDDRQALCRVHVLEHRRRIQGDRRIFGDRLAFVIGQYSKMHLQLALTCIYRTFHDAPLLFSRVHLARREYKVFSIQHSES